MPQIEVNLAKLIRGYDALNRLAERNRDRIEAVCRERGVEVLRLTEEERERFIDDLLHQAS